MKKTNESALEYNNSLLNIITPIGLELKRNSLIIGENTGRIYGVVKYPQKVDYGWLAKITNIPGTVVGITFIPIDNGEFISGLVVTLFYGMEKVQLRLTQDVFV